MFHRRFPVGTAFSSQHLIAPSFHGRKRMLVDVATRLALTKIFDMKEKRWNCS